MALTMCSLTGVVNFPVNVTSDARMVEVTTVKMVDVLEVMVLVIVSVINNILCGWQQDCFCVCRRAVSDL